MNETSSNFKLLSRYISNFLMMLWSYVVYFDSIWMVSSFFYSSSLSSSYGNYFFRIFLARIEIHTVFFVVFQTKYVVYMINSIIMMNLDLKLLWMVNIYAYISAIYKKRTLSHWFYLFTFLWQIDFIFLSFFRSFSCDLSSVHFRCPSPLIDSGDLNSSAENGIAYDVKWKRTIN